MVHNSSRELEKHSNILVNRDYSNISIVLSIITFVPEKPSDTTNSILNQYYACYLIEVTEQDIVSSSMGDFAYMLTKFFYFLDIGFLYDLDGFKSTVNEAEETSSVCISKVIEKKALTEKGVTDLFFYFLDIGFLYDLDGFKSTVNEAEETSSVCISKVIEKKALTEKGVTDLDNLDLHNFLVGNKTTTDVAVEKTLEIKKVPSEGKTNTKRAGQITDTKSPSQITGPKTAGQITDTKPAGQITHNKSASQIRGTKTEGQITDTRRAGQITHNKSARQMTGTKTKGQIADTKNAKQITDTKSADQVRELRQKVQKEVGWMPKIVKDTENKKNENHNYIKEFCGKQKQDNEFEACGETKYTVQLENRNNEEKEDTLGDKEENEEVKVEEVADNFQENDENQATSKQLDTFTTKDQMQVEVTNAAADRRCNHESTIIKLYRNVVRNETERMMTSIGMVVSEAEQLFGLERTRIFLDLMNYNLFHFGSANYNLFHFGSALAISTFVPNMAESDVRQHVISFFVHACDTMNRLMTLLLSCPDSTNLQQMPEQNFISLMQSVINTSLKTNYNGRERISLEESTWIMVDSEEFEKMLGVEIPEDILDRSRRGEEMVAHMFVNTKLEITQAPERRESRPIPCLYFPSDCRLFISIPTESGSYWHALDMQRANSISKQDKYLFKCL